MKNNYLKHKNYLGSTEFDIENGILYGKILFINDIITYEGRTVDELTAAFIESVDDYLQTCEELGRDPQKVHSGSFNIRIGEEIHRDAAMLAFKRGQKLNEFIKEAIAEKIAGLKEDKPPTQLNVTVQKIYTMEKDTSPEQDSIPGLDTFFTTLDSPSTKNKEALN